MKKIFILTLASAALLLSSCNKFNREEPASDARAALTISINKSTKAVYAGSDLLTKENEVKTMEVLVFSKASKVKEKQQTITSSLTGTINGLTIGTKRVVVVANPSAALKGQLSAITSYDDLNDAAKVSLELTSQTGTDGLVGTAGFTMIGENDNVALVAGSSNSATVEVERVVAKIKLGTITIAPATGYDASKLSLSKVYVQKVRSKSMLGKSTWHIASPASFQWMGGTTDNASITTVADAGRFSGTIANTGTTVTTNNGDFFYVMPNDNTDGNCTLLTIEGTYDSVKQYYVFRVNDQTLPGIDESGHFVRNNRFYTLNVTLKRLGDGSTDPDVPSDPATLDVTVSVKNWVVVPTQSVEW